MVLFAQPLERSMEQTLLLSQSRVTASSETTAVFPAIVGKWNASVHYLIGRHRHEHPFRRRIGDGERAGGHTG
jgi:hypothetical protein